MTRVVSMVAIIDYDCRLVLVLSRRADRSRSGLYSGEGEGGKTEWEIEPGQRGCTVTKVLQLRSQDQDIEVKSILMGEEKLWLKVEALGKIL